MHDMIMDILRTVHQVADQLRIRRDGVIERVFHRTNGCQPMHQRADAADALREGPGIARIATPQDDLDTAHHGPCRVGLCNAITFHLRLDTQMALDARDGINNDTFSHE